MPVGADESHHIRDFLASNHAMKKNTTEGLLPPMLSIKEVAEAIGFHDRTIRRHIYSGLLPAVRFGPRCVRIKREDVLKLLSPIAPGEAGDAA